jgi:hypothetical protein
MASIITFNPPAKCEQPESGPAPRTYNLEITAYPDNYLEFRANGIHTDPRSLYKIADELRKVASIICSDVMTTNSAV